MSSDDTHDRPDTDRPPRSRRLTAWLQLLRVPNLLTVPGDPIAGLVLASLALGSPISRPVLRAALAAAVSLLLYAAGLLWNDWFDLADDRRDRPTRPLPAGLVRPASVAVAANMLIALAVAVAAVAGATTLYVAIALGAAVLAYNGLTKRLRILGPVNMGLCRGLSLLIGAAAFGPAALRAPGVLAAAGGLAAYIAAVTWLASAETRRVPIRSKAMLVITAAGAWMLAVIATVQSPVQYGRSLVTGFCVVATLWLTASLSRLGRRPPPEVVQRTVGELIRGVVVMQAAQVAAAGWPGLCIAAGLAVCFGLNGLLGRRFYAS